MTTEQINVKLTIWGTNGGSQVFCSDASREELNTQEFKGALQEFASVFLSAGLPFYGLEYTRDYKVYTIYTSALETTNARSGIFLAATIFVPHKYNLLDPLAYLQDLGKKVKETFLDLNGRYKGGLPPSIEREFAEYREAKVQQEHIQRGDFVSDTKGSLAYIICPDDASIAAILREPYRREFKVHQEVLLIPQAQLERGYFNDKVGQPLELGRLSRQHNGYRLQRNELIAELRIAGEVRTQDYATQYLSSDTLLELRLAKEGYEPIAYSADLLRTYLAKGVLTQQGEEELRLNEDKLAWRRLKKTVRFPLRPDVFRQTECVELQIGDMPYQNLTRHLYDGSFSIELEEDLLRKGASLYLYKAGEGKAHLLSLEALLDAELIAKKCQAFSYPEQPIVPKHEPVNPDKPNSQTGGTTDSGSARTTTTLRGGSVQREQEKQPWKNGYKSQDKGREKPEYEPVKELPYDPLAASLRYWKELLIALLFCLLLGYLIGNLLSSPSPAQNTVGGVPPTPAPVVKEVEQSVYGSKLTKFTKEAAISWLAASTSVTGGKLDNEGFWTYHKDGLEFLYEKIKGLEAELDSLKKTSIQPSQGGNSPKKRERELKEKEKSFLKLSKKLRIEGNKEEERSLKEQIEQLKAEVRPWVKALNITNLPQDIEEQLK